MIALRSLATSGGRLRPLGRPLRQNWWRLWRRFVADRRDAALWSALPPARRAPLQALARETARLRPPLHVRLEGELRWRVWRVRQALGRRSSSADSGARSAP